MAEASAGGGGDELFGPRRSQPEPDAPEPEPESDARVQEPRSAEARPTPLVTEVPGRRATAEPLDPLSALFVTGPIGTVTGPVDLATGPVGTATGPGDLATRPYEMPIDDDRIAYVPATLGGVALGWVDTERIARSPKPSADLSTAMTPYIPVETDLLAGAGRRSPFRPGVLIPVGIFAALVALYCATTLLWPLTAVAPVVAEVQIQPIPAPAAAPAWPAKGSASVSVAGMPGAPLASTEKQGRIASITKIVTALLVLDEMPLDRGEQGPEYAFTWRDRSDYWSYLGGGESALDVPVGGTLTQYELLEGMLIGSANNYADRLAQGLWPSDQVFANAAKEWLDEHGIDGVTVVDPTGIEKGNKATPAALLALAQRALQNPIIAEIVAKKSVKLPGAGTVKNTNSLLADPGVIGLKTGYLPPSYNLLSAKEIMIGETKVRMYASVLGQKSNKERIAATRALFAQVEAELQLKPSVDGGTVVGNVKTAWGESVPVVTAGAASVVLWNGAAGSVATAFDLDDHRDAGDVVGALTVDGPLDSATVDVRLDGDVEDPSAWWRLTHPLELFGLAG
jgi:D-alanyl-D-alanine carboxypeptidase (penicillin-binding protein 5/6)